MSGLFFEQCSYESFLRTSIKYKVKNQYISLTNPQDDGTLVVQAH